jgi:hypothetical protein
MARAKSNPGSKTSRTNNKEQAGSSVPEVKAPEQTAQAVSAPEGKAATGTTLASQTKVEREATPAPEVKSAPKTQASPEPRKLEVVKNESRKNVVPINLEDEIRRRAYEIYQQRGAGSGSEAEDWLTAEREVRQRYRQQSA